MKKFPSRTATPLTALGLTTPIRSQPTASSSRGVAPHATLTSNLGAVPRPMVSRGGRTIKSGDTLSAECAQGAIKKGVRSVTRGKRVLNEIVCSRPKNLPTKVGSSGRQIIVQANYFKLNKKPSWTIHIYRVDFNPQIDIMSFRRTYLAEHKARFGGYVFDGTVIFTATYFLEPNKILELYSQNDKGEKIKIKIKHAGTVNATDYQILQVLNLVLRRCMQGLKLQLSGRNFYDTEAQIDINEFKLQIWPGYLTSIRQHERDILVCCEITHKVLRTETLHDILKKITMEEGNVEINFKKSVIGTVVVTPYNNKTYRIDDVDFALNPMKTFDSKKGKRNYIDYYREKYGIIIRDREQPLLLSRPTERNIRSGKTDLILLVPELCKATGLTEEMRKDVGLMRGVADHTRLIPERRIQRLGAFRNRIQTCEESRKTLTTWNMELDKNLVELPARVLPPQKVIFGEGRKYVCDTYADWTREIRNGPMFTQVTLDNWYVIFPQRTEAEVKNFVKMLICATKSMKLRISEPKYLILPNDRVTSYSNGIETAASKDPKILMIIVSGNSEDRYKCIKKKCCVERPVPSQVVAARTITPRGDRSGGMMSIATKIVIQINTKLAGCPWTIDIPLKGLMTVGFDVCHTGKKSYGALIATMDLQQKQRYFSSVMAHLPGQELSNEIAMNMTFALKQYREMHGCLPVSILFYRDGVGDGQLYHVFHTEVQVIKAKLDEIYTNAGVNKCRFTFIVVSKRINTRIFQNKQNPPPGTVVDEVITLPERYDFFLVSQSVRQGTVSPTSYNIIFDGMELGADRYQILTYRMTHLYYNWSGTLRVPAVCQYAHKLAFLVAEAIGQAPSNVLQNQLYFL